jgi:hypothetical protein
LVQVGELAVELSKCLAVFGSCPLKFWHRCGVGMC